MPTEKKTKKTTLKKNLKKNVVEEKLNEMVNETAAVKPPKKKLKFPWWTLVFVILATCFALILLYQLVPDFKKSANKMIDSGLGKNSKSVEEVKTFDLPLTVIYNANSENQKSLIDRYLANFEFNLPNTKAQVKWLNKDDEEAQTLLKKIGAKSIPQFITTAVIKTHPLYNSFAEAIKEVEGEFVFMTEGLEYFVFPDANDGINLGAPVENAKIVVMQYLSYSCGHCKNLHPVFNEMVEKYGKDIAFVVKFYDRGGPDLLLSQAGLCARDLGRFSLFTDNIFERQSEIFDALQKLKENPRAMEDFLKSVAGESGINLSRLFTCINKATYAETVKKQTQEGVDFGVLGTPTLFIGTQYIGGEIDSETFSRIIEEELVKVQ